MLSGNSPDFFATVSPAIAVRQQFTYDDDDDELPFLRDLAPMQQPFSHIEEAASLPTSSTTAFANITWAGQGLPLPPSLFTLAAAGSQEPPPRIPSYPAANLPSRLQQGDFHPPTPSRHPPSISYLAPPTPASIHKLPSNGPAAPTQVGFFNVSINMVRSPDIPPRTACFAYQRMPNVPCLQPHPLPANAALAVAPAPAVPLPPLPAMAPPPWPWSAAGWPPRLHPVLLTEVQKQQQQHQGLQQQQLQPRQGRQQGFDLHAEASTAASDGTGSGLQVDTVKDAYLQERLLAEISAAPWPASIPAEDISSSASPGLACYTASTSGSALRSPATSMAAGGWLPRSTQQQQQRQQLGSGITAAIAVDYGGSNDYSCFPYAAAGQSPALAARMPASRNAGDLQSVSGEAFPLPPAANDVVQPPNTLFGNYGSTAGGDCTAVASASCDGARSCASAFGGAAVSFDTIVTAAAAEATAAWPFMRSSVRSSSQSTAPSPQPRLGAGRSFAATAAGFGAGAAAGAVSTAAAAIIDGLETAADAYGAVNDKANVAAAAAADDEENGEEEADDDMETEDGGFGASHREESSEDLQDATTATPQQQPATAARAKTNAAGATGRSRARGIGGSGNDDGISLETLRTAFDLPASQAAAALRLSATGLKRHCRKLDIHRWPQRKLQSLGNIDDAAASDAALTEEERKVIRESVARNRESILADPNAPLLPYLTSLRQTQYKKSYDRRTGTGAGVGTSRRQ